MKERRRKCLRLPRYDYAAPGAYFVTICVQDRDCIFGDVSDGTMRLSSAGRRVEETWQNLPAHYPHIAIDEFIVMPNHVHGVIIIRDDGGAALMEVIRAFKSFSSREINKTRSGGSKFSWQRGFHEHVVRGEKDLGAIREYIQNNPIKWDLDEENPERSR